MPAIGQTVSHYKIVEKLGRGGMGEVYQAQDLTLGRDVAIKVPPEEFSLDPERVARFEREARLLASVNHPNIAAIHGFEESNGTNLLIMELVEGETLADRLKHGPIGVEESLKLALQIAEALEAAHEKGIIHRDLKPANIKITSEGKVKVFDFGLAKAFGGTAAAVGSDSCTATLGATLPGTVVGTAAYMSPEQAAGARVDKRSDIWSFGAVLWEMLTGNRLFAGETTSHILADVLRAPIDFGQLADAARVPAPITGLLRRCLDRDVRTRLRDIGEARIAIADYPADPEDAPDERAGTSTPVKAWAAAAACALIAGALAFVHFREAPEPRQKLRVQLNAPQGTTELQLALSPDGRHLAFAANARGKPQLWLRHLDAAQAQALPGTEDASYPFWSPDGRYLGFFAQGKLKKVLAGGGPPQVICDTQDGRGGSWNREDTILFSTDDGGGFAIRRVSAAGGTPAVEYKSPKGISRFPVFLPDGRHFLYVVTRASSEENGIYFRSMDGKENRRLLPDESSVVFASGHLLFIRENSLIAQPFDPGTGRIAGDPVQLVPGVSTTLNVVYAPVTASENGILIYQSGGRPSANNQLVWYDRSGRRGDTLGAPSPVFEPAISPDGKSVAFMRLSSSGSDLWIWDLARSTERRFTTDPAFEMSPFWSSQANRIVFRSNRGGGIFSLYQQVVGGNRGDEAVLVSATRKRPTQWTRDGKLIVYTDRDPETKEDIWTLPMENGKPGPPRVFLHSEFVEDDGQLSPDGNWMTYTSNESGRTEIYVRAFPSCEQPKKISTAGGDDPRWRSDGKELYFIAADGTMMSVPIKIGTGPDPSIEAGSPQMLFQASMLAYYGESGGAYDVTPDGKRFLLTTFADVAGAATVLDVVVNWDRPRP